MANPVFSIIIPTLNAGKTLERALASIASQDCESYEVLIVDGVSADDTKEIATKFTAQNKRFFWQAANDKGIYFAMNTGLKMAKGEWVFFLGSDDYLFSNDVLSAVQMAIAENKAARFIYGNVQSNEPMILNSGNLIYDGPFTAEKLIRRNICHQCIFYHRSLFKRFGYFRTKYLIFSDYDFNLRCFNRVASLHLDKTIAHFTVGGSSVTRKNLDERFPNDFLENMAVEYAYHFSDAYFIGRKKELLTLLLKNLKRLNFFKAARLGRVIAHHGLRKPGSYKALNISNNSVANTK